jgi:ABC-type phosphate transport system substrate-binding protein
MVEINKTGPERGSRDASGARCGRRAPFGFFGPWLRTLLLLILAVSAGRALADVVVVANPRSAQTGLSKEQVSALFLGKLTALPWGGRAALCDQPDSSPAREEFYARLTGKSVAQIRAHWAKMSFTGKGVPPTEERGSAEVKKAVSAQPGAIGYIERSDVDGSVKVIYSFQ